MGQQYRQWTNNGITHQMTTISTQISLVFRNTNIPFPKSPCIRSYFHHHCCHVSYIRSTTDLEFGWNIFFSKRKKFSINLGKYILFPVFYHHHLDSEETTHIQLGVCYAYNTRFNVNGKPTLPNPVCFANCCIQHSTKCNNKKSKASNTQSCGRARPQKNERKAEKECKRKNELKARTHTLPAVLCV